jgi:bifunctional DNA-binding transcriptional regulator/antitoxin component of YhaV-PrlF toxin-antitoxin module
MKMTVVIDKFGRMVLPKAVRNALGIFERGPLTLEMVGGKAELTAAAPPRSEVKRKGGRTVYAGLIPEHWDSGEAVLEMRTRRLQRP